MNEALPTCSICSATMCEGQKNKRIVDYTCLACGYTNNIGYIQSIRENAIMDGKVDEEYN